MAVYRYSTKILSRSAGKCAMAGSAYLSGEKLHDSRTNYACDGEKYHREQDVLAEGVIAPENAPEWMRNRQQLWDAVEAAENRKDAQTARQVIVSLPHELTHEQRHELLKDFIQNAYVSKGMVADYGVHAPHEKGDERHFHAHIQLTMREATPEGFAATKNRDWNTREQHNEWRSQWADYQNKHLETAGSDARVDHRSNADQGLDRIPEPVMGPVATKMEREGQESHAGNDRRNVQMLNAERTETRNNIRQIEAEIVNLEEERAKRMARTSKPQQPEKPQPEIHIEQLSPEQVKELNLETYKRQEQARQEGIKQAEAAETKKTPEQEYREQEKAKQQEDGEFAAEQAKRLKLAQAEEAAELERKSGIADPQLRWMVAQSKYNANDHWGSMSVATGNEFALFAERQQALFDQAEKYKLNNELEKSRITILGAHIEGADYMLFGNQKCMGYAKYVAGNDHSANVASLEHSSAMWAERRETLMNERNYLMGQEQQRENEKVAAKVSEYEKSVQAGTEPRPSQFTDRNRNYNSNEHKGSGEKSDHAQSQPEGAEGGNQTGGAGRAKSGGGRGM